MKSILPSLIIALAFLSACRQQQVLRAEIFERKALKGNRLLIYYRYSYNHKTYTDSATVLNVVIDTDSIPILIDPENLGKSLPDLKK